jgi:L-gulono-1,4-lactone dehydrogenase
MSEQWHNWARNQVARPQAIEHPANEDELVAIVKRAAAGGGRVKVVGSGHSFTPTALTDGVLVELDRFGRVLHIDTERMQVTVEAGITIAELNEQLDARGLAMPNLGDIAYQTISGAISTSTHGTGAGLTGIAAQAAGMRLVTGDGSVVSCSRDDEGEVFSAARVGVGALGAISSVTLDVVPAFNLAVREAPERLDELLADLDHHVDGNDHFEFFWVPHTGWALTKRNNRTTGPLAPMSKFSHWRSKVLMENYAFGAVCYVGRARPQWIPKLAKALPSSGPNEYTDKSYKVFASPRIVRFYEMEYAIPREACAEALNRVRKFVADEQLLLNFPVEVRFTAPDDIPLSTASGRASAYIAIHVFQKMEYDRYFRGVEAIMNDYGGRPHWGKLHFQNAASLRARYPRWDAFVAVRDRIDPDGRFTNDYLRTVLGR